MQKIIPYLWFDHNAEEAAQFYVSVFGNAAVTSIARYPAVGQEIHHMEAGSVMTLAFEIEGFRFLALNGGPVFSFTPAISFMVNCAGADEVNALWEKLSEGGVPLMPIDKYPFSERYGWIKDKYGVTWQLMVGTAAQKIMPSLMYAGDQAGKAEEAIAFYASVFKNSSVGMMARYGAEQAPDKEGTLMYADFALEGQKFAAMDSARSHEFTFNEAVSLLVQCDTQEEIDYYYGSLSADPEAQQCGWTKDRYGVSWQVAPKGMDAMLNDPDKHKGERAMQAMLQMKKIDIATLQDAFEGK